MPFLKYLYGIFFLSIVVCLGYSRNEISIRSNTNSLEFIINERYQKILWIRISSPGKCSTLVKLDEKHDTTMKFGDCGTMARFNLYYHRWNIRIQFSDVKLLPSLRYKLETPVGVKYFDLHYTMIKSIRAISRAASQAYIAWEDDFSRYYATRAFLIGLHRNYKCQVAYIISVRPHPKLNFDSCAISRNTLFINLPASQTNSYNLTIKISKYDKEWRNILMVAENQLGWSQSAYATISVIGAPTQFKYMDSLYFDLKLQWRRPYNSNKEDIVEYNVFMMSFDKVCLIKWTYICSDCKINGYSKPRSSHCSNSMLRSYTLYYSKESEIIVLEYNDQQIIPGTRYFIIVQARSTLDWGDVSTLNITISTKPFKKTFQELFKSDIQLQNIMMREIINKFDRSQQISITLPLESLNGKYDVITKISVIVSLSSPIMKYSTLSNQNQLFDETYSQCQKKTSCIYEIIINMPSRYKRNISPEFRENRGFLIGSMLECSNNNHQCNGRLKAGKTYKIGLRIYSNESFITVGVIERKTGPDVSNNSMSTAIACYLDSFGMTSIITIIVVIFVILRYLVIIVVLIVKRRLLFRCCYKSSEVKNSQPSSSINAAYQVSGNECLS